MNTSTFQQFKAGSAVDKTGVVRGVSLITGGIEAVGHGLHTDQTTVKQTVEVCAKFGRIKVKLNHGGGVQDVVGFIDGFRVEGNQAKGDLHLLPSHPQTAFIRGLIETQPELFGLSLSFSRGIEERDGKQFVRVLDVLSCDLVDRPAANPNGLFGQGELPGSTKNFNQLVTDGVVSGLSASEAIFAAVSSNPEAYAQWRASGQTDRLDLVPPPGLADFKALVARQVSAGKTKAEAIQFCVQHFPRQYAMWRAGDTSTI
jgi:hypothetical protein